MKKSGLLAFFAAVAAQCAMAEHPATKWAREELSGYSAGIFGKAVKARFVLPGEAEGFEADFAALKGTDGYAVRRSGDGIVFVADCPKGHVNGVHRWLERNSDIVWPRPAGDMCFFTPSEKTLGELDCDYIDVPVFNIRYFGGGAPDGETRRYLARNSVSPTAGLGTSNSVAVEDMEKYATIGGYCDVYGGGHDMETRWFPRSEFFKDHPEFWMEINGERWTGKHSNFCETNPEFVKAYCKSVLGKIANLPPTVKILSINMEDTGQTCTCANCVKPITLADGTVVRKDDPAFASTRFFIFFNEVARAVAKVRADLKILQFAYLHLAVPPKVPVERNVILKFCPYPRNMRESVMEGPSNAKWRDRINGWFDNTPGIYWREYYFCQCISYPRPIADTAAVDLRKIAERGVKYVYTDSPSRNGDGDAIIKMYSHNRPAREFFDMCAMEAWTVEKLFWNPSLDPETLRAEFLRRTFGPASPHMAEFFGLLRKSWYGETEPSRFNDNSTRCAARFIVAKGLAGKCRAALAAAEAAADRPERRKWIAEMRAILGRWIKDAPNYVNCEIAIPAVKAENVQVSGQDGLSAAPWSEGAVLPAFKLMRAGRMIDKTDTKTVMFSDGEAFNIAFDVAKRGKIRTFRPGVKAAYPCGDKVEAAFALNGTYFQFAAGAGGDGFASKGLEGNFAGKWSVKTFRTGKGWRAVMRIPFDSIGFRPVADPVVRFMASVSYSCGDAPSQTMAYSLGGAAPHSPKTWLEIRVDTEARAPVRQKPHAAVPDRRDDFHLFILGGQSNMSGRGDLTADNRVPHDRVLVMSQNGKWREAVEPFHWDKRAGKAGLAATFARAYADAHPGVTVGLVPVAYGGSPIRAWQPGARHYTNAVHYAKIAAKDGVIKGFLWHQGESDAFTMERVKGYLPKFTNAITCLRREFGIENVPFLAGELGPYLKDWYEERRPNIFWREMNGEIAKGVKLLPDAALVPSEGLYEVKKDKIHFATPALRKFGERYWDVFRKMEKKGE